MHLSNKFNLFLHKEKAKVLNLKTLTNLRENMLNKTWDHIYSCRDPDTAYNLLVNEITDYAEHHPRESCCEWHHK